MYHTRILLPAIGVLALLMPLQATASEQFSGQVIAVPAGDVITVMHNGMGRNIRLYGVDAPDQGQPLSDKAQAFVSEKVKDQEVTVEVLAKDSTGTAVGNVALPGGGSLNEAVLTAGLAWWDKKNAPEAKSHRNLNAKAIVGKQGIWSDPVPLAPWDFRSSQSAEEITYTAEAAAAEPAPAVEEMPAEDEPKRLEAKGNASQFIDASGFEWNQDVNALGLIAKHPPQFPKDAQGKVIGMSVPNISGIPYASQLGFKDGDIVTGVNGVNINTDDINSLMGMVPQFKGAKTFNVTVLRDGQPVNITIQP